MKEMLYHIQQTMFARQRAANDAQEIAAMWARRLDEAKLEASALGLDPEQLLKEAHEEWLGTQS